MEVSKQTNGDGAPIGGYLILRCVYVCVWEREFRFANFFSLFIVCFSFPSVKVGAFYMKISLIISQHSR